MRSLVIGIFMIIFLIGCFLGQTLEMSNPDINIYNYTESTLIWPYDQPQKINVTGYDYNQVSNKRLSNLISNGINFFGYSMFELTKWSVEFGYAHPEYDYNFMMNVIIWWMIIVLVLALIPALVPIIALIYLIIIGIKKIYYKFRQR